MNNLSTTIEEQALEKIHNAMKRYFSGKQGADKTLSDISEITNAVNQVLDTARELCTEEDMVDALREELEQREKACTLLHKKFFEAQRKFEGITN